MTFTEGQGVFFVNARNQLVAAVVVEEWRDHQNKMDRVEVRYKGQHGWSQTSPPKDRVTAVDYSCGVKIMKSRHDEVVEAAARLGLTAVASDTNIWLVYWGEKCCGTLVYNPRSGLWRTFGGRLSKTHYGTLGGLLNLLTCAKGAS